MFMAHRMHTLISSGWLGHGPSREQRLPAHSVRLAPASQQVAARRKSQMRGRKKLIPIE